MKTPHIREYLKKYYNQMAIRQKMIMSLILFVIIPIIVLGILFSVRMFRLSERNQYEMQINQLLRSANDIDTLNQNVTREAAVLSGDDSINAVLSGNATVMDYKNAAQNMNLAGDKIEFCSVIAVSKNGRVLFQRGPSYMEESENKEFTDKIESDEVLYLWTAGNEVDFKQGINITTKPQISFYTSIMKKLTLQNEGVLSIHIDEEAVLGKLLPYSDNEIGQNIILFDEEGNVILSNSEDTEMIDLCRSNIWQEDNQKDAGYFTVDSSEGPQIALYAKCDESGWYMLQTEKKISYLGTQFIFIFSVILLCVLFGCIYGMIQNQTIIKPLHHLAERIHVVKQGVLEKKEYEVAGDEIGNVESGFEDMVSHINKLINQVYVQTIKTQEAEREMMLAKINPHFLYNSLDSIHWLAIRNKDYEVSELLEVLADIYRKILASGEGMISIREDMEFINDYIFLLDFQMGDRIEFIKDIPEEFRAYVIPKLITQPLIENAVGHGLNKTKTYGKVKIRIRKKNDKLNIYVIDNGIGCDADELNRILQEENSESAFALRNIHDRIRLRFGGEYGIKIYSRHGWGTIVKVTVGMEEKA